MNKRCSMFIILVMLSGCSSLGNTNKLKEENTELQKSLLETQDDVKELSDKLVELEHHQEDNNKEGHRENECLIRYMDASNICTLHFREDEPGLLTNHNIAQCISGKGYPEGIESCSNSLNN